MAAGSDSEADPGSSPLSSLASELLADSPTHSRTAPPQDNTAEDSIHVNTGNPKSSPSSPSEMKTITETGSASGRHKKRDFSKAFQKITTVASAASKKAKKATIDKRWQPDYVLTHDRSPLGSADLRAILCHPDAWESLTPGEQAEVLALFPDKQHVLDPDTDAACPNVMSLLNDDNFRHDCARYVEDLQSGMHDTEWMEQAWEAHEMRRTGVFDDYLAQNFEDTWEVELPEALKPAAIRAAAAAAARGDAPAMTGGDGNKGDDDDADELGQEIHARSNRAKDNNTNGSKTDAVEATSCNEYRDKSAPALATTATNGHDGSQESTETNPGKPSEEVETESTAYRADSPASKASMDVSEGKNSTDNEVAKGVDAMVVR